MNTSGNPVGYIGYLYDPLFKVVCNLKIMSFDIERPNFVLARDLINLFNKFFTGEENITVNRIDWSAFKENPAIKSYRKILEYYKKEGFSVIEQDHKEQTGEVDERISDFTIQKRKN